MKKRTLTQQYAALEWWKAPKGQNQRIADLVIQTGKAIKQVHRHVEFKNMGNALRYEGKRTQATLAAGLATGANNTLPMMQSGAKYNLVYSVIDTLQSKLAKSQPKPSFITTGGDYKLRKTAALLDQVCQGLFYQEHVYEKALDVLQDALVFGTGVFRVGNRFGKVVVDHVCPNDLWPDRLDSRFGGPRSIFQGSLIDRYRLSELYPEKRAQVLALPDYQPSIARPVAPGISHIGSVIEVWDAIRLPSGPGAGDGRHIVVCHDTVLLDEPWEEDCFPFIFLRFNKTNIGFWGRGISELLQGHHDELERTMAVEAQCHRLMSVPKIWVEQSSQANLMHVASNQLAVVGTYRGQPPTSTTWNAVNPDFVSYKQWIIDSAYSYVGVSQLSAGSQKPAGLNAAVALREMTDIESDRFSCFSSRWDHMFEELGRRIIGEGKKLYADDRKFSVMVPGERFIKTVPWKRVDLAADEFILQVWSTNRLPSTPAGKMQFVQEAMQAGFMDIKTGARILGSGNPDLQAITSRQQAAQDDIDATIDAMVEDGVYNPPDLTQDLPLGITTAHEAMLLAKHNGTPEAHVELLVRWMDEAQAKLDQVQKSLQLQQSAQQAQVAAAAQPQNPQPQAVPAARPVSELLSNAPAQQ